MRAVRGPRARGQHGRGFAVVAQRGAQLLQGPVRQSGAAAETSELDPKIALAARLQSVCSALQAKHASPCNRIAADIQESANPC